jgi:hypothetical protein
VSEQAWTDARLARDRLVSQLLNDPDVSLVDIGQEDGQLVLRVHVRSGPDPRKEIPVEIDGIPVRVVRGDYKPEAAGS